MWGPPTYLCDVRASESDGVISTKRIWTARPFLVAYVVAVGFVLGLLVNRTPRELPVIPAVAGPETEEQGIHPGEREVEEPPLWVQVFRPSQPTARRMLRMGLPVLSVVDGSARELENRTVLVYWTGQVGQRPQSLFQTVLPFLRPAPPEQVAKGPNPSEGKPPETEKRSDKPKVNEPPPAAPPAQPERPAPVSGGLPLVGIYHTHNWESYVSEVNLRAIQTIKDLSATNVFDDKTRTIVDLGQLLAEKLQGQGITAVHAPFKHERDGYDYAYSLSRNTARRILREAPSVAILLDLHRDAAPGLDATAVISGREVAQIRCIIGQGNPDWEANKAFCDQLVQQANRLYPGLVLPTKIAEHETYNQDLLPGAVLLEIGNATNDFAEAERAVAHLAEVLAAMIRQGKYPQ